MEGEDDENDLGLTGHGYKQQRYLHFVRDAVYAVAHALDTLRIEHCPENPNGTCEAMQHLNESRFIEILRNVSFHGKHNNLNGSLCRSGNCYGSIYIFNNTQLYMV
jgi:hypothetical protein